MLPSVELDVDVDVRPFPFPFPCSFPFPLLLRRPCPVVMCSFLTLAVRCNMTCIGEVEVAVVDDVDDVSTRVQISPASTTGLNTNTAPTTVDANGNGEGTGGREGEGDNNRSREVTAAGTGCAPAALPEADGRGPSALTSICTCCGATISILFLSTI